MRKLIFLAVVVIVHAEIDWSQLKPRDIYLEENGASARAGPQHRIIGGQETVPHAYPFQVALFGPGFFCGGSLISRKYVLTAAHCTEGRGNTSIRAYLGSHNIFQSEGTRQIIQSESYVNHPDWNLAKIVNDIGIIKLSTEAVLNDYVKIISLPKRSDVSNSYAGETAIVIGWGKTSGTPISGPSPVLRYITIDVATNQECKLAYTGILTIESTHICTRNVGTLKNTCNGDSGGMLIFNNTQIGVVSFGYISCESTLYGGFTRVTAFLNWIAANSDVQLQD